MIQGSSSELFARSLLVAPGGVHSPVRAFKGVGGTPIFFQKAKGAFLTSVEGDSYIDFCQSFGPNILGHLDEEVLSEVRQAIEDSWTFGACDPYSLELAEWICERLPFVDKIRFVCSGTEAVMSALRVARAATGRSKVLKFEGCYHGHADPLLVKAGSGLAGDSASDSAGVSDQVAHDTIVAPLDNEERFTQIFEKHKNELAAVILEPLPANFGLLIQRREFIEHVVNMARKNKVLVIFDEVISGFRVKLGGMAEVLRIKPDLVTYGKVIGGGFPVGAYGGRGDLMSLVAPEGPVYQAGTLAANPVGMRAGLATLKKIERDNIYRDLRVRSEQFAHSLQESFVQVGAPLKVSHFGSLFWIHQNLQAEIRSPDQFRPEMRDSYKLFFHQCLKEKVYLAPSAFEVGFVSWAHDDEILLESIERMKKAARVAYAK